MSLSDEVIAQLENGTFEYEGIDLDEIIAESMGIWMEENGIDQMDYWVNEEPMDFVYKFIGTDADGAMFEVTFEDGRKITYPVPLYYFS